MLLCLMLSGLAGCVETGAMDGAGAAQGRAVYDRNCLHCHGRGGIGAGPASLGLGQTPPELRGLSRQNNGTFPRAYLIHLIAGHPNRNDPDAAMPDFSTHRLGARPSGISTAEPVHLSPELKSLLAYLESIQE